MAHHYAIRTFDETAPVVRGGAAAASQAAGNTLDTVVPPDWRLIQLMETGRKTELDAVTVSFAALLQEVWNHHRRPRRSVTAGSAGGGPPRAARRMGARARRSRT